MEPRFELKDIAVYPEVDQQLILYRLCNLTFLLGYLSVQYGTGVEDVIDDIRNSELSVREILEGAIEGEPIGSLRWQVLSKYLNYLLGGDPSLESLISPEKRADSEERTGRILRRLLDRKLSMGDDNNNLE